MHALAKGIAHFQHADDLVGKSLDHRNLETEPEIPDLGGERSAFVEQRCGPHRQRLQALQQRRRRLRLSEHLDRRARRCERIARQIDAVEIAIILGAILQMIVDLQAGAQRIGCGPGRGALAMHVEHEAPDRHRRVAAIMDDFVPVLVTKFGDVHPERDQDIERMARRHRALGQRVAQINRFFLGVAVAEQFRLEQVEIAKLVVGAQRRMIGNVVGGPHEIVERQDQRPVTRMNDPRRDRKILVAVGLSGSQIARAGHQELATFIWAWRIRRCSAHARDRVPHIGEYAAKTNAISAVRAGPRAGSHTPVTRLAATFGCERGLLPVAFQHLIAGGGDLGAILLEAGEDGEVALIDHRAAVALNVAGASGLFLRRATALLLGKGIRRNRYRQQGESQDKFTHRIPSFSAAKTRSRIAFRHGRDGFVGIADAAYRSNEKRTSTGKCGQICGGPAVPGQPFDI